MNIPDKIRKLLESEDVGDIIIGLQLFCKANDNEQFDKFIRDLLEYEDVIRSLDIKYHSGYYFIYKNVCIFASKSNKNMFVVRNVSKIYAIYEYSGKS